MDAICKNCETAYADNYKYCPECSQKAKLHRLTFHDIIHEAIHYFTHADKGFFQLIRDLILKRGLVARQYVDGKRKKYFPPLNFFLLVAAVFVFIANIQEVKETVDVLKANPHLNAIANPIKKLHAVEIMERKEKVIHFMNKYSNLMAMCSLPLTAMVFWVFYRKSKYNYIEHLVAGMYMLGICILFYALIILPLSYVFKFEGNPAVGLFFLTQFVYFAVFYYGFLGKTTKLQFLKASGVSLMSLIVWIIISGSMVKFYISSGFGGLLH